MGSVNKRLLEKAGGKALVRFQHYLSKKTPEQIEAIGERLGRAFFRLSKKRRERAISNLAFPYPDMPYEARMRIARDVFAHFGRCTTDFLTSGGQTLQSFESSTEVVGIEHLKTALERGKGVLMVTGHFGNFERLSTWFSLAGYPMNVVIRDADQADVNQIVNNIRTQYGTKIIPRGNAARPMLERLRANEVIGIISDQNAEDIFLPFFGKPAGTNLGVGVIQERTGAAVLPTTCVYLGPNKYRLTFYPLLEPLEGYETKGEGLLRAINSWLETVILEHPEQWLWLHDRWRNAREAGLL